MIIFAELKFMWELGNGLYQYGFFGMVQYYGGIGLYNLRIRDVDDPIGDEDMTPQMTAFCVFYFGVVCMYRHVEYFLELLALTAAVMFYYCSVQFIDVIKDQSHFDMKLVRDYFISLSFIIVGIFNS